MEKMLGEDDIKGLEEEIDSAVDRLFVEKKRGLEESLLTESPVSKPSYEMEKSLDLETSIHPPSIPDPFLKSIEKMETQLLTLEWEITKENLKKTKEEAFTLRETMKEKPDVTSVLNFMEKVLDRMINNEEDIRPPLIKFLLDSKETVKLLMKKETNSEINIYKQLAHLGIEARFFCLEGIKDTITKRPTLSLSEDVGRTEIPDTVGKEIEEVLSKWNLFLEKMDGVLKKFDYHLSMIERVAIKSAEKLVETKPLPVNVTIFKVNEKIFGVESDKVFKLFKVPNTFSDKYSNKQKIRLKDFEVRIIDLKKIFTIQGGDRKGEIKILTVKENSEYKGLMVDQVLKKLSTHTNIGGEYGEYFLGMVHWTYQERPVEIPILDLKKF
jgi:hypothetical protein